MDSTQLALVTHRMQNNDLESPSVSEPSTPSSPTPPRTTKLLQTSGESSRAGPSKPLIASDDSGSVKYPVLKYRDDEDDPKATAEKEAELANAWGKEDENGVVASEEFAIDKGKGRAEPVDLFAGRVLAAKQRQEKKEPRPPAIERRWNEMYMLVKTWWQLKGKPLNPSRQSSVNKLQSLIKKDCRKLVPEKFAQDSEKYAKLIKVQTEAIIAAAADDLESQPSRAIAEKEATLKVKEMIVEELFDKYKFPQETLQVQLTGMAGTINQIEKFNASPPTIGNKDEEEAHKKTVREQVNLLLDGFAVFQEKLKELDIPLHALMSDFAQKTFEQTVNESPESLTRWKDTIAELQKPTDDQTKIWTQATPQMQALIKSVAATSTNVHKKDVAVQELTRKLGEMDSQIEVHNQQHELPISLNRLPVSLMQQLRSDWECGNDSGRKATAKSLTTYLECRPLGQAFLEHNETHSRLKQLTGIRTKPLLEAGPSRSEQSNATRLPLPPVAKGGLPLSPVAKGGLPLSPVAKGSLFVPEAQQPLRLSLADDDVIEMFDYQDGRTEFGLHEATRPCQTDNIRFTRFIVNAGTAQQPYYAIIQGNELCPGGAETLLKATEKETIFNLRQRKLRIKADPSYLRKVGPCVVKTRSDTYRAVPGSRTRRPDTYIQVHYKDAEVEWLTRTEYVQLVGKKCAERHLEALTARYARRTDYMKQCKNASLHPTTGAPLSAQDQVDTPWLFPNSECLPSLPSQARNSGEVAKMDWEPEIDDQDAPSPKKRVDLSTYVYQSGDEL